MFFSIFFVYRGKFVNYKSSKLQIKSVSLQLLQIQKMKSKQYILAFIATMFALLLCVACDDKKGENQTTQLDEFNHRVRELSRNGDPEGALKVVDSLEDVGFISDAMANGMRGSVYYIDKQFRTSEYYFKKAVADNTLLEENPRTFVNMSSMVASGLLLPRQEYDEAIDIATRAYAVAKERMEDMDKTEVAALLNTIGQCEVEMGRFDEGEKNLTQSIQMQRLLTEPDTTGQETRSMMRYIINATIAYMNEYQYERAMPWIEEMEQLLEDPICERVDTVFLDMARSRVSFMKADALAHMGRLSEAKESYERAMSTHYGRTPDGNIDAGSYLEAVGRWADAAETYVALDSLMQQRGVPLTLDNIQLMLTPQFRTFLMLRRLDDAVVVGQRICEALDSAIVWQRKNDSAELATIYETQEKEAKIAEQNAKLSRHRLVTTVVIVALVLIFLAVYSVYRYHATRRLNMEHKKLRQAHDLLENANRNLEKLNKQLAQKNADLLVANERAEESSRMKTDFIEQMSHEIRTPLNILSGFTQIVTTPGMELTDEEKVEISRDIIKNTDRITGLVNKMLELSDASSQTVIERTEQVAAGDIAMAAIEESRILEANHLTFDFLQAEGADFAMLLTSQRHAVRVLTLLLENACKFTRPAEATGEVEVTDKQHVNLKMCLWENSIAYVVEDTGVGIPPEEAEHVFEKFVQLDEYYDGTGIGLTVARGLARRLGGDVVLDTSYTKGACFILTLPVEKEDKTTEGE